MGDSLHGLFPPPPVQDSAHSKSKVKVFANVPTCHEGSVLNTPNALTDWLNITKGFFSLLQFLFELPQLFQLLKFLLLILLRYMSEKQLKNYRQHWLLTKTYKTSTQVFHMLSGKTAHPLELPGISQKYKDSTVDLMNSVWKKSPVLTPF